jgi:hypothetical protein
MAEWYTDRFGNSKRVRRVLKKDCELFGNGIIQPHHASHIVSSESAMRQEAHKHTANQVICPLTGRIFRHVRYMHKYHEKLQEPDAATGLMVITMDTARACSPDKTGRTMRLIDTDGDGKINPEELKAAQSKGVTPMTKPSGRGVR